MTSYVIACRTPWFWDAWQHLAGSPSGRWFEVREPPLTLEFLERIKPRYVFFPHWSQIVAAEIVEQWECVCFHSAPVPYGRGGSPVQNMIVRGHDSTEVTALRMVQEVDAGPVYLREQVSLLGGGDEVFLRIANVICKLILAMVSDQPTPVPQHGDVLSFKRRTPGDSRLPSETSLEGLFDFIRMLDAEGYPPAFADVGPWRLELRRPALRRGSIQADVRITRRDEIDGG